MLSLFSRKAAIDAPELPRGGLGRVYAVGDVHGRLDLFMAMLQRIGDDLAERPSPLFQIIFLGDLIDRGPQSARVVESAMTLARGTSRLRFLKGNHEEMLLRAHDGDAQVAQRYYSVGGRETLASYGLEDRAGDAMSGEELVAWMQAAIPAEHIAFLSRFEDMIQSGDYVFVHAGIKPGVPLHAQQVSDLRWIRGEFLRADRPYPGVVVHGHSITDALDEQPHRIGVDTGAYRSGRLTAIAIEGEARWSLTACDAEIGPRWNAAAGLEYLLSPQP